MLKKILLGFFALFLIGAFGIYLAYTSAVQNLPKIIKLEDYKPLLVTEVFDRNSKKVGEFYRERRVLIPYKDMPKHVVQAFLAAEDAQFFQHHGFNFQGAARAFIANMRAGKTVQGGSTITQQLAKTMFLSTEQTVNRKIKDILLSIEIEKNLSKEDILYLYLNQINFGQSAYGIEMAAQTYFRKPAKDLEIEEAAILASIPKSPTNLNPTRNPVRAKERQLYVLNRMADEGFITKQRAEEGKKKPIKIYLKEGYDKLAPFYLETVRQLLVKQLGEDTLLNEGLKVYTSLDLEKQASANESVVNGLKELDKRQGFRGASHNFASEEEIEKFLAEERKDLILLSNPERTILEDGTFADIDWSYKKKKVETKGKVDEKLPSYLKIGQTYKAVVQTVNDGLSYVEVRLPGIKGYIDLEAMQWAKKLTNNDGSEVKFVKNPNQILKQGDVIEVKIISESLTSLAKPKAKKKKGEASEVAKMPESKEHLLVELDQEPLVEGALLSIDQQTQDVLAMVGGYSFSKNQFNRALQAARQTGSSFKAIVYAAALDNGYNPSSLIIDAPIAFGKGSEEGQEGKTWTPSNHEKNFNGEITMRNALVKSLNIPSVKIMEDIGVDYATEFSRRLGIFSKLNPDFTLVLGSSSVTLYEMTKVFSQFGRNGLRTRPKMIKKVLSQNGKVLLDGLDLDVRFFDELKKIDDVFEQKRTAYKDNTENGGGHYFFEDPEQLIKPEIAYVITDMLRGTVNDPNGTGGRAAQLGREIAGKTGTTNGYIDGWFVGYTANIATGVWVGFDKERTIGKGEVGGRSALPIWLEYMKFAHLNLPVLSFTQPDKVKIVKVDAETGKLPNSGTKRAISLAFVEGTEPTTAASRFEETTDQLKQDIDE